MPDTRIRIQNAPQLLRDDHRKVRVLFSEYGDPGTGQRAEKMHLFLELKKELTIHAAIEEEIFYPAIRRVDEEEAQNLIDEAEEEHQIVKILLDELSALVPRDPAFDAAMNRLRENVEDHAGEEEREMFPYFDFLDADEREDVTERLRQRRQDLMEDYS